MIDGALNIAGAKGQCPKHCVQSSDIAASRERRFADPSRVGNSAAARSRQSFPDRIRRPGVESTTNHLGSL
jgi:hypothetical protein